VRDNVTIDYINQGLIENQLCVYASVNAYDRSNLSKVLDKIKGYKENIVKRNLLIVNLRPFYDSALRGDLTTNIVKYVRSNVSSLIFTGWSKLL